MSDLSNRIEIQTEDLEAILRVKNILDRSTFIGKAYEQVGATDRMLDHLASAIRTSLEKDIRDQEDQENGVINA